MPLRIVCGNWHYRFQIAGEVHTANTGVLADGTKRNRTRAEQIEAKARLLVLEGRGWELTVQSIPFSSAVERYLIFSDAEAAAATSARRARASFASLVRFFGRKPVVGITPGDVDDYKAWRRLCIACGGKGGECAACKGTGKGVRDITIRHDLHALAPFFRWAKRHGWARGNPVNEVEIPGAAGAVRINVVTLDQERAYFDACLRLGHVDLHDVGRLMILQGPRPNEVLKAAKADLELERGTWRVGSKTEAGERTLDLLAESRSILARRFVDPRNPGPWLFPSPRVPGEHISRYDKTHEAVVKQIGFRFVPYDLRHTFATRAAMAGVQVASLAKILGHSNASVTLRYYVHVTNDHLKSETQRLERYLEDQNRRNQQSKPSGTVN